VKLLRTIDPFVTTKPPGTGLGLGLTLSYNIVKDLGGTLKLARSGPDGTAFVIDLKAESS
jgi:two-component system, NtrC family, C4-dicarboxylate transport sensor histidine kinase DctB